MSDDENRGNRGVMEDSDCRPLVGWAGLPVGEVVGDEWARTTDKRVVTDDTAAERANETARQRTSLLRRTDHACCFLYGLVRGYARERRDE